MVTMRIVHLDPKEESIALFLSQHEADQLWKELGATLLSSEYLQKMEKLLREVVVERD